MRGFRAARIGSAAAAVLMLSACAGGNFRPVSDRPVKIGQPYAIRGTTYVPAADPSYDMLGYASWYGRESGNRTANGERFQPAWFTAAHTTLPLPTYVEVTALDTGRRIIVRVNDRGPFVRGPRIIDLSRGAAELLGMKAQGQARVRVRRVEPSEKDRERLRRGKPAGDLPPVSERVLPYLRTQLSAAGCSTGVGGTRQNGGYRHSGAVGEQPLSGGFLRVERFLPCVRRDPGGLKLRQDALQNQCDPCVACLFHDAKGSRMTFGDLLRLDGKVRHVDQDVPAPPGSLQSAHGLAHDLHIAGHRGTVPETAQRYAQHPQVMVRRYLEHATSFMAA